MLGNRLTATLLTLLAVTWGSAVRAERLSVKRQKAEELVREALHCEIYGLSQDRDRLLQEALAEYPDHASAHWHRGRVLYGRQWVEADQNPTTTREQTKWERYTRIRAQSSPTAAGHLSLANWCADQGLHAQERAHLLRVVQLDPNSAEAPQRLGFVRGENGWVPRDVLWQALRDQQRVMESLERWRKPLAEIRDDLLHRSQHKRDAAQERLLAIQDVSAIPAIEMLAGDVPQIARWAVEALGSMQQHEASMSLARIALFHTVPEVSTAAVRELKQRPQEEFVPALLAEMSAPIESRYAAALVNGHLIYRHAFFAEGQHSNQLQVADAVYQRSPRYTVSPGPENPARDSFYGALYNSLAQQRKQWGITGEQANQILFNAGCPLYDATLGYGVRIDPAEIAHDRTVAVLDIMDTIQGRETRKNLQNAAIQEMNRRIMSVLREISYRRDLHTPQDWWDWWRQQNEVTQTGPKSNRSAYSREQHTLTYTVSAAPTKYFYPMRPGYLSCFVAGTTVLTISGPRPIEQLATGDLVLSQDVDTGQVQFQPVITTTRRPPAEIIKIHLGSGQELQATGGHPFWVSGTGWTRARELESGMMLHTLHGGIPVSCIEKAPPETTYNLVVDEFHTYFVGDGQLLCHDNELFAPTNAIVPGLLTE